MSTTWRERVLINVGCGPRLDGRLPACFANWHQTRVDSDPGVEPDVVADLIDLSHFSDASADAVWAAHCMEHLYEHQVPLALNEFRRILRDDGFLCVIVPDLQTVASYIADDRLHEPLYQSPAGPVTPHDVTFGFGAAIAAGQTSMAHRCGFTPGLLQRCFNRQHYPEIVIRRRSATLELAVVARVTPSKDEAERTALMSALEL